MEWRQGRPGNRAIAQHPRIRYNRVTLLSNRGASDKPQHPGNNRRSCPDINTETLNIPHMKKTDTLEQRIRRELAAGRGKKQVLAELSRKHDREEVLSIVNTIPDEDRRQRYRWLNWLLCLLLFLVTAKKLYDIAILQLTAVAVHQFSPLLLLYLIVPMINFYVLGKLVRCHKQGYQFMIVLGVLALVRPENRISPDIWFYLVIIGLSIFLLRQLFPKNHQITD